MLNYKYFRVGRVFLLALLLVSSFLILFTFAKPTDAAAQCDDGIDNDGDGAVDYTGSTNRGDQGCTSVNDNDEGFRLRVSVSGRGTVTTTGINCTSNSSAPTQDCKEEYDTGTPITLNTSPLAGSRFKEWVGACTGTASTCNLSMSQARDVLAVFEPTGTFTLTVNQTGVVGTVYSNPPGINGCTTANCTGTFPSGTTVRIYSYLPNNAQPTGDTHWSNCEVLDYEDLDFEQDEADCEVILDGNKTVSSFFPTRSNTNYFPLSVVLSGTGSGAVYSNEANNPVLSCGSNFILGMLNSAGCNVSYNQWDGFVGVRKMVTLTASPNLVNGSTFGSWSGDCTGTQLTCTVAMSQARNVTATFNNSSGVRKHRIYAKRLSTLIPDNGNHGAVISSAPGGIACGGDCGEYYQLGTALNLTPTLALGYDYNGDYYSTYGSLYGMCVGAAPICRVYISQPYHLQTISGPVCNDKIDNDGDNLIDGNGVGSNARDPQCVEPTGYNGNENGTTEGPSTPISSNFTLNVTKNLSTGTGIVTGDTNPATDPINCGTDCTSTYTQNADVVLSSIPTAGQYFFGYTSGCLSVQTNLKDCILRMVSDLTVNVKYVSGPVCNDAKDNDEDGLIDFAGSDIRSIKEGDINQDGIIDVTDVQACLQVAEPFPYSSVSAYKKIAADVNNDGRITVGVQNDEGNTTDDCNIILRWSVGLQTPIRPNNVVVGPDPQCTSAIGTTEGLPPNYSLNINAAGPVGAGKVTAPDLLTTEINCSTGTPSSGDCTQDYTPGAAVSLRQTTNPGFAFNGWSGDTTCTVTTNPCVVTMSAAKNVTATFTQNTYLLTTGRTSVNGGSGTVTAVYGANTQTCNTGVCSYQVDQNSNVTLTATPDVNSLFVRWVDAGTVNTSTVCPGGSPCGPFVMNAAKTVYAEFRRFRCSDTSSGVAFDNDGDGLANYPADPGCASALDDDEGARLRVTTVGNGMASIMYATDVTPPPWNPGANPPWIYACRSSVDPNSCNEHYDNNTDVSVTLSADPGYTGTWTGCDSLSTIGTNNPNNKCKVNIRNYLSRNITATFTALPACSNRLDDDGDGLIDMGYDWNNDGDYNDVGEYSPDPGCSSPTDTQEGFRLTTTVSGSGSVSATSPADPGSNPPWIDNCTQSGTASTCSEHYDSGVNVILTATPIPSGQVVQWTGCTSSIGNICNVLMNSMKQVSVVFIPSNACTDRLDNDGDGLADTSGVDLNTDGDFTDPGEFAPDPGCAGGGNDEKPRLQVDVAAAGTISINSSPAGITNCNSANKTTSACNEHFTTGTTVTLTSTSVNTNWTNCSVEYGLSCTVVMNTSKTVTAELRTQCNDGIDNDQDGDIDYPADTGCTSRYGPTEGITASCVGTPNPASPLEDVVWTVTTVNGCTFPTSTYNYTWTGDVNATNWGSHSPSDSQTVSYGTVGTKIANVSIFATDQETPSRCAGNAQTSCQIEVIDSLRLTSGRVDLNPIDGESLGTVRMRVGDMSTLCEDFICVRNVNPDYNNVGVTAFPNSDVIFVKWVGADGYTQSTVCPGNASPCNFDMNTNTTVFAQYRHSACTDGIDNDGDGEIDFGTDGSWDDGCDGPTDDDENPKLTVVKTGTGTGRVYSNPLGISFPPGVDCGPICVDSFETDSVVILTAIRNPLDNSRFVGWSDNCAPIDASRCEVAMDISREVTAMFTIGPATENCFDGIDNDGDGDVDGADADCRHQCNDGIDNDEDGDVDGADANCIDGAVWEGITAYCVVNPSPADVNQNVTWSAYIRNACPGTGNVTNYTWQDHLTGANTQQVVRQYSTPGIRNASVGIFNHPLDDLSGRCGGFAVSPQCTNDTGGPGVYVRPPQSPQILNLGILGAVTQPNANSISESSALLPTCTAFNPSVCSNNVFSGDEFLLTYNRASGHAFVAWRGDQCAGSFARTCAVIMPESTQTILAEFELTECNDTVDNDEDGLTDWPADEDSCTNIDDDREGGGGVCDDGLDNDGDGLIDEQDPMCWDDPTDPSTYNPNGTRENDPSLSTCSTVVYPDLTTRDFCPTDAKCNDGLDNDGDGFIDYGGACTDSSGALISAYVGPTVADTATHCAGIGGVWHPADPFCQGDPTRRAESFSQLFQEF